MSFRFPLDNFEISQGFGGNAEYYKKYGQIGHNGLDLACRAGEPVYAADEGSVEFEGWGQNHSWMGAVAGICVIINHIGSFGGYAHLASTVISKGQKVSKGQLIGYAGSTGGATGPHLHFEMLPLKPNFSNGYAGRINPMPFIETTQNATDAQIRQAYTDILERQADADGLANYRAYTNDFVRQDLSNSAEKRTLEAAKAEASRAAAELAARVAANRIEEATKAAEAKAAQEAAKQAADQLAAAEAEKARIAEEERVAREAAEQKAQEQRDIEEATKGGDNVTTPEDIDKVNPVQPVEVKSPTEATKSSALFVARIASMVTVARIIVEGLAAIVEQQIAVVADQFVLGVATLIIAALIIFWAELGYQLAKNLGWKWAENLKWPF